MTQSDLQITLISQFSLQNQLLVNHLQDKLGMPCLLCEKASNTFSNNDVDADNIHLVLFDCLGMDQAAIMDYLESNSKMVLSHKNYILFNLYTEADIEKEALDLGVKGFIYRHESADALLKAMAAVSAGEIWISRKKLTECFVVKTRSNHKQVSGLTRREVGILACLCKGYSNEMIGDNLCISPHTVKTHLANIFKKINVRKRRQAALWADKNLR